MIDNLTYCAGHRCALRTHCLRYTEGQHVPDGFNCWMQNCDEETRDGFININE